MGIMIDYLKRKLKRLVGIDERNSLEKLRDAGKSMRKGFGKGFKGSECNVKN